jgi:hypothetical protein
LMRAVVSCFTCFATWTWVAILLSVSIKR